MEQQPIHIGDRVQLRKKHPCGSDEWIIDRVGVDIGMRCAGCNRRIMLARSIFYKRLKTLLHRTGVSQVQEESP